MLLVIILYIRFYSSSTKDILSCVVLFRQPYWKFQHSIQHKVSHSALAAVIIYSSYIFPEFPERGCPTSTAINIIPNNQVPRVVRSQFTVLSWRMARLQVQKCNQSFNRSVTSINHSLAICGLWKMCRGTKKAESGSQVWQQEQVLLKRRFLSVGIEGTKMKVWEERLKIKYSRNK